jgi:hypothetical protein
VKVCSDIVWLIIKYMKECEKSDIISVLHRRSYMMKYLIFHDAIFS